MIANFNISLLLVFAQLSDFLTIHESVLSKPALIYAKMKDTYQLRMRADSSDPLMLTFSSCFYRNRKRLAL